MMKDEATIPCHLRQGFVQLMLSQYLSNWSWQSFFIWPLAILIDFFQTWFLVYNAKGYFINNWKNDGV